MTEARAVEKLVYTLPPVLDLLAAQSLKDELLSYYHKEGDLQLEGEGVERIATPCIEVLVAASEAFARSDRGFHINNPSEYFAEAVETLGLSEYLARWRIS